MKYVLLLTICLIAAENESDVFTIQSIQSVKSVQERNLQEKSPSDQFNDRPRGNDVGVFSYDSPTTVLPYTFLCPTVTVHNWGTNTSTFNVTCEIPSAYYTSSRRVTDLVPGNSEQVTFDDFMFFYLTYNVTVYTLLRGDEYPENDTLSTQVFVSCWARYDDGIPANAWAWEAAGNGWGVRFAAPGCSTGSWVDSIAVYFWDDSWPVPGDTHATFRLYDGKKSPTNMRQELTHVTITRDAWNILGTDTTCNHFADGENIYLFYIQCKAFPHCAGLTVDEMIDAPITGLWWYNDSSHSFGTEGLSGDWLLRLHVLPDDYSTVGEWINTTPTIIKLRVPAISNGDMIIHFVIPRKTDVELALYDATGARAATLAHKILNAGTHAIPVSLNLTQGVYFVRLQTESARVTKKVLLVK